MSTIKLTQEQRDKKAQAAYLAFGHARCWSTCNLSTKNFWTSIAIAVLESDGDKVEIIEPEPEIPEKAVYIALSAFTNNKEVHEQWGPFNLADMRRALGAVVKSGLLPGREPK